jgi:hypothetical protein
MNEMGSREIFLPRLQSLTLPGARFIRGEGTAAPLVRRKEISAGMQRLRLLNCINLSNYQGDELIPTLAEVEWDGIEQGAESEEEE